MSEKEKKELGTTEESKSSEKKAEKKGAGKWKKAAEASRKWFRELKSEFKKIVWPTRKQLWKNTAVVAAVLIAVGVVVGLIDVLFQTVFLDGLLKLVTGY